MRRRLLSEGAKELSYEIREIVKKANQLKALGLPIHWENPTAVTATAPPRACWKPANSW